MVTTWQVPAASTVDDEKLITAKERPYVPLRRLELSNAFPVLQGYKNTIGAGYHANFEDPLHFASLGITAAYTPEEKLASDERGHVDITGRYGFWHGELSWNRPDFYDLFGPTERSRKGYAAKLGYDWLLIYDTPKRLDLLFDVAYYDKIDTLPNAQNIATSFTQLATAEIGLHYTDLQRSLGAVDDEKGVTWELVYYGSHVPGETAPQFRAGLDLGFPVPLPHSSIWLRSAAGVANGDRDSVIANFYFGAFGNNYVDDGSIKRYRDYSSLPGFQIDEVSAQNYVARNARMEPSAVRIRIGGHAELLPDMAAAIAVRHRTLDRPRKRSKPRGVPKRRRAGGLEFQYPEPLQHDAVGRIRGGPRAVRAY